MALTSDQDIKKPYESSTSTKSSDAEYDIEKSKEFQ